MADIDDGYISRNGFLRWWPKGLLALAAAIISVRPSHSIQWVTLLAIVAYIHGRWLPWQFAIRADGITLTFPFGRQMFLPRAALTVRMEMVGAVAMVDHRRFLGYLLLEHMGYEPTSEARLRRVFNGFGYNLA